MKHRILLAEDELVISRTLKAILEIRGFEVETAASAGEAVAKLQGGPYHMVITDMKMEEAESGYRVIRAAHRAAYDPVIAVLTAYPPLGTRWKAEGAQAMMVKPMAMEELLGQIDGLLVQHESRKRRRNQAVPQRPSFEGLGC